MKTEHTPTPWRTSAHGAKPGTVIFSGVSSLAETNSCYGSMDKADAAYIVLCVNSHEALVTALDWCVRFGDLHALAGLRDKAEAALKLAKP